jgi:hypothetical protein
MKKLLVVFLAVSAPLAAETYDLAVYGATAGGVMTAVAGARSGLRVVLLEPGRHVGGMVSGGLGASDFGRKEVIGGYAAEFFRRAGDYYHTGQYGSRESWYFEPHVAEAILIQMLDEAHVTLLRGKRMKESGGVTKSGPTIQAIQMEDGSSYAARVFADCSYEGDLMAQAGVSYTWGRESSQQYGESLAGVRDHTPYHQFLVPVSAYDSNHKLLPEIYAGSKGEPGAADRKVQAYNFRLCLTQRTDILVPFPKPAGYDPARYELLARLIAALAAHGGRAPEMHQFMNNIAVPNGKTDVNNNGAFSTDYIGASWEYPEASYQRRSEIFQAHVNYTQGFFWFLGHDERVPESLRQEVNSWGLAGDEFTDSHHWPHQLYIREARRMTGAFVMTQKDLQTDLHKADSIGKGSYNSDSHNVQRIATPSGEVENEGDMEVPVTPYEIPYRILLPKREQAVNLLTPVCFSASHVAYSSVRMEPQYMILGQAAGTAAALAVKKNQAVQDVDTAELQKILREQKAIL